MAKYQEKFFQGERSLFAEKGAEIIRTTFGHGESPLKESSDISLKDSIFKWKYPLWYSDHIKVDHTVFEEMSRSGIWYTHDIEIVNSSLQAPKLFRRSSRISLKNDHFSDAAETLWNCSDIKIENVTANGDYFGMNSENIYVDHLDLIGNYIFDGGKNIEVHNSNLVSKDAFWNCENVTVYDSFINGEYLAWNTKNIRFVNCTIESDQGLCYIDDLTLENCRLLETDLAFEYCSNVKSDIHSHITSVKNPISGTIVADSIGKVILNSKRIDHDHLNITVRNSQEAEAK